MAPFRPENPSIIYSRLQLKPCWWEFFNGGTLRVGPRRLREVWIFMQSCGNVGLDCADYINFLADDPDTELSEMLRALGGSGIYGGRESFSSRKTFGWLNALKWEKSKLKHIQAGG